MHLPWLLVLCLKSLVCLGLCQGKFRLHMALPLCLCLWVQVSPFYKDIVILDQGSPSWPHFNLIHCKDPNSKQDHIHRDQGLGFQHFLKGCNSIHNTRQPWSKNYFTFPLHYCRLSYLKINLTVLLLWASLVAQMVKILLQCRRPRFDPWVRKIPGEGNGTLLQYSSLENPMDRGAWWATVHGAKESDTAQPLTLSLLFLGNYSHRKKAPHFLDVCNLQSFSL